jgi:acetyltransferase EpsM
MKNNVFIWGSKSYALLVDDILTNYTKKIELKYLQSTKKKLKIKYIFDPYSKKSTYKLNGTYFNKLNMFKKNIKKCDSFVVCIGNNFGKARYQISLFIEKFDLKPLTLVSKNSSFGSKIKIGKGVVAMPNTYVNSFTEIGDYSILNSSCNIEHECKIGKGTHIMSGACIAGKCQIGDFVTIGTNATILPNVKIDSGAYIGAGAVVTKNVKKNSIIVGVPGKHFKSNKLNIDDKIIRKILNYK